MDRSNNRGPSASLSWQGQKLSVRFPSCSLVRSLAHTRLIPRAGTTGSLPCGQVVWDESSPEGHRIISLLVGRLHLLQRSTQTDPSSGVEASSSASLAAYLNSLQFSVEESAAWFGKGSGWRVTSGTYCCFNAFSRVDMRVEATIPGGVFAYIVDLRGDKWVLHHYRSSPGRTLITDTTQRQNSGRRHTSLPCSGLSATQTTPRTAWQDIASWILSTRSRRNSAFSAPPKRSSSAAGNLAQTQRSRSLPLSTTTSQLPFSNTLQTPFAWRKPPTCSKGCYRKSLMSQYSSQGVTSG